MKGASFEREVSTKLSLWWSNQTRSDIFYRTPGSGGRFTNRRKSGKDTANHAGDQLASDPSGQPLMDCWSVECKTGYGKKTDSGVNRWDILDFLDSRQKEPILQKMWAQCKRDAELSNKEPILIFRRNNRAPCIMFRTSYMLHLQDFYGDYLDFHLFVRTTLNCVIIPLDSFFEWIPNIRASLKPKKKQIKIRR